MDEAKGADRRLDAFVTDLRRDAGGLAGTAPPGPEIEGQARRLVERLALALQGSLLVRHSPPAVADAFCASRLAGDGGRAFGTLPPGADLEAILLRHERADL